MKFKHAKISEIEVPAEFQRAPSRADRAADDILLRSIAVGGIQQPPMCIDVDGQIVVVKGTRRIRLALEAGLDRVPIFIDDVPHGVVPMDYARQLRFVLDHHRQDLVPSQKAETIGKLKEPPYSMNQKQISAYLCCNEDTVTNLLAVKKYIRPVVKALDTGALTMVAARVFVGLTPEGQKHIWEKHGKDLAKTPGDALHKQLRAKYPPERFEAFYRDPELVADRLKRKSGKRKSTPRPSFTPAEKRRMLDRYEYKENEIKAGRAELKELRSEINLAIAPVAAILRDEQLLGAVPEEMRDELTVFGQAYC